MAQNSGISQSQAWKALTGTAYTYKNIMQYRSRYGDEAWNRALLGTPDLVSAEKILGTGLEGAQRIVSEINASGGVRDGISPTEAVTRIARLDLAVSAKRQQREGLGSSAQSAAVRRALAVARGRQGTIMGGGEDPGRKSVLGGGI